MNYLQQFTELYPNLVHEMKVCEHNSSYHMEGSVWTHTCMVYSHVQALHPDNKVLLLSAILHDIGKVLAYRVDENNKTRFSGHEGYSALVARSFLDDFNCTDQEIIDILTVISLHGVNISQLSDIPYLSMFRKADAAGRISNKPLEDYAPRRFHKPHPKPTQTITILCGLPCSGKSTYALDFDNVISRDAFLMTHYATTDEDYNTAYSRVHSDPTILADFNSAFDKHLQQASKSKVDYIIDMTMLSLSDRRSIMAKFPKAKFNCVVFLPPLSVIEARNKDRKGKSLDDSIYHKMSAKFVMPTKAEGFGSIQYILR